MKKLISNLRGLLGLGLMALVLGANAGEMMDKQGMGEGKMMEGHEMDSHSVHEDSMKDSMEEKTMEMEMMEEKPKDGMMRKEKMNMPM